GGASGNAIVRMPCWSRACRIFSMLCSSEVEAAVREIEALVAERTVGDLLAAHREREPAPVVERRIHDLVSGNAPRLVGAHHVADLSAPSLDQRNRQVVGCERSTVRSQRPGRQLLELLLNESGGALDLDPAQEGAGENVAAVPARAGHLCEAIDP